MSPYTSAVAVSVAAIVCGEMIPMQGRDLLAVPLLGRLAACTSLPLLFACFAALRTAARTGPPLLRTYAYENLNLGLAMASIAACAVTPHPVLSVIIARGGSALLCLEVWSQSSNARAGDPFAELGFALRALAQTAQRTTTHLLSWPQSLIGGGGVGAVGRDDDGGGAAAGTMGTGVSAGFAALAVAHATMAVAALRAPPAALAAALWPVVSPGTGVARIACSTSVLSAFAAAVLADATGAGRSLSGVAAELAPFRRLNSALGVSAALHLLIQLVAAALWRIAPMGGALAGAVAVGSSVSTRALIGFGLAQLVLLATAIVSLANDAAFYN